ncbi:MAG: DNA alkylation repair protein [Methylophaga sp.]|uniref:DNA alkylation repair protein n=1 Tax=Methylophaga sp. UBA678 TaxID=1946901 RepID=UPI000C39F28F|nr:DNA alkylation repair protein [Methylophaga sp. UBA678]MAX53404.1 DNA alkylation repair protein [Methylophaga sp.]|tara:strand:- start:21389 stop:22498 length:1110 start_codon:yes stop_codon:yes gene_type:complete
MAEQLKNKLHIPAVKEIGSLIHSVWPDFAVTDFIETASLKLDELELKARADYLAKSLHVYLPHDYVDAINILLEAAESLRDEHFSGWAHYLAWPLIDYVALYGLEHRNVSFAALEKLTSLFTAEFAIRFFLKAHFDETYQQMLLWAEHDDEHVRRLASEGIRPRLPWAPQLAELRHDPALIWPLLEKLKSDSSLYVRRSVANNINDMSKDHPQMVIDVCSQWQKNASDNTSWVIRHAMRSLVKQGITDVYPLLGFSHSVNIEQAQLRLSQPVLQLGDTLVLELGILSHQIQYLVLDYKIRFVGAGGKISREKVFKWKNIHLSEGQYLQLEKRHSLKKISTRQYYPGTHEVECLLNGQCVARASFELLMP